MSKQLNGDELIGLVTRIMNANGSEKELDDLQKLLERNVADPNVSDYIFYPHEEMTPEEIVDKALADRLIQLPDD